MSEKSNYKGFELFLVLSLLLLFVCGCAKDMPVIIEINNDNLSNENSMINNMTTNTSIDIVNYTSSNESQSNVLNETVKVSPVDGSSCIISYPMFYTDEKGAYRSTQVKLENYSLSFSASRDFLDVRFNARMNTINPNEERYSSTEGYERRLPNDESSCINPEWIFNSYSIAMCNVTKVEPEKINSQKYQGEILIFNHSVAGCLANHSSERRVWIGCGEGSTTSTCLLPAFAEGAIGVTAVQKSEDEISSMTIRINNGDVLSSWDKESFRTPYFLATSFKIATDSLEERLYKVEIQLTLKNGKKETYERQLRITSPSPLLDYEFEPDCFSNVTLKIDNEVNIRHMGEITLKNIFRMPKMVYIKVMGINSPWALGYGTDRSSRPEYKVVSVNIDREEIVLQTYDPFCKGVSN